MPDVPALPVVTAACFFCCRRAMGAACTRHSLRPLVFEGNERMYHPGTNVPRKGEVMSLHRHCERSEAIHSAPADAMWIASSLRSSQCRRLSENCLTRMTAPSYQAPGAYCIAATRMPVGPRITTNSTGRKNRIIGTVSFGGSAAAFFSASFMRMSRFSCAITRRLWPSGVP